MPLLNYTTQISGEKSVSEIGRALARVGASRIMHEYDDNGFIVALAFEIDLNGNGISFRLPTDWRPVLKVLEQDPKVPMRLANQEQALRVAWRITKDWVEAQAAFIETMMVTTAQVFLPYAVTTNGGTLYEQIATDPSMLLGEGREKQDR